MSAADEVLVVPTGGANLASVCAAFERLGARPRLVGAPGELESSAPAVLPGVGSFGAARAELERREYDEVLARRVAAGGSLLAICLGLQLLCEASEEAPGVAGLAAIPSDVRRLEARRVPQLGWNRVEPVRSELLEPGWAYFANTYGAPAVPPGWGGATTEYGAPFASALERGALLACQFHPELSGAWGAALLERWLGRAREVA